VTGNNWRAGDCLFTRVPPDRNWCPIPVSPIASLQTHLIAQVSCWRTDGSGRSRALWPERLQASGLVVRWM